MTNQQAIRILRRIQRRMHRIERMLDHAEHDHNHERKGGVMAIDPKVAALILQFDAATDKIAARIQKLINAGGLSAESAAALQAEVDKLNLLGQDPENPVPPAAG